MDTPTDSHRQVIAGVEFGSAIENAVAVLTERLGPSMSRQQAWEHVAALARTKLSRNQSGDTETGVPDPASNSNSEPHRPSTADTTGDPAGAAWDINLTETEFVHGPEQEELDAQILGLLAPHPGLQLREQDLDLDLDMSMYPPQDQQPTVTNLEPEDTETRSEPLAGPDTQVQPDTRAEAQVASRNLGHLPVTTGRVGRRTAAHPHPHPHPSVATSRRAPASRVPNGARRQRHIQISPRAGEFLLNQIEDGTCSQVAPPRRGRPSERGMSCARCTIRRKKCTGNAEICDNCSSSKLYRELCVPADFKESRRLFHSLYETRVQTLLSNIAAWVPPVHNAPITIAVSSGFNATLELRLRQYTAVDKSMLVHFLFRSLEAGMVPPRVMSTAFALEEGTLTAEKIDEYCDALVLDLALDEAWREQNGRNRLAAHIIMFAARQCYAPDEETSLKGLEMVRLSLRFWAMQAVFFKCPWDIVQGALQIGMHPLPIPGFWHGRTLLPRLVNQELDQAFEKRMDEIEREILAHLQHAVFHSHRDSWCAIFLTCFLLLHSLEKDSWNLLAWECEVNRPGAVQRWPLARAPADYREQNGYIAALVATHFRVVNQGRDPFRIDWSKALNRELLNGCADALSFVSSIQKELRSSESGYRRELTEQRSFDRADIGSLNYLYTKKLILD